MSFRFPLRVSINFCLQDDDKKNVTFDFEMLYSHIGKSNAVGGHFSRENGAACLAETVPLPSKSNHREGRVYAKALRTRSPAPVPKPRIVQPTYCFTETSQSYAPPAKRARMDTEYCPPAQYPASRLPSSYKPAAPMERYYPAQYAFRKESRYVPPMEGHNRPAKAYRTQWEIPSRYRFHPSNVKNFFVSTSRPASYYTTRRW